MINPFGSEKLEPLYVEDQSEREALKLEAETLSSIKISSAAAANAVMLGAGYFNPLKGFMNLEEMQSVAESMKLSSGVFWPVPIINMVPEDELGSEILNQPRIALKDPNVDGNPVIALQEVESIETLGEDEKKAEEEHVVRDSQSSFS